MLILDQFTMQSFSMWDQLKLATSMTKMARSNVISSHDARGIDARGIEN